MGLGVIVGDNFQRHLAAGRPSLGICLTIPSPELVDVYGRAGWDLFYANMHSSRIDWDALSHMNRAARTWGITACARIPMQPWVGPASPGVLVDAHRAYALGSSVVMASVRGAAEAADLIELSQVESRRKKQTLLAIPAVETASAWSRLNDLLRLDGLAAVFLGLADIGAEMGQSGLEDPDQLAMVEDFVRRAHRHGVAAAVNTGYAPDPVSAWELTQGRAGRLLTAGVDLVFTEPTEEFLFNQSHALRTSLFEPAGASTGRRTPTPPGDDR